MSAEPAFTDGNNRLVLPFIGETMLICVKCVISACTILNWNLRGLQVKPPEPGTGM